MDQRRDLIETASRESSIQEVEEKGFWASFWRWSTPAAGDEITPASPSPDGTPVPLIDAASAEEILNETSKRLSLTQTQEARFTEKFHPTLEPESQVPKPHQIEYLADRDDTNLLKPWKRYCYFSSGVLTVTAFLAYLLYFALRIWFTTAAQRKNRTIYPAAWIFVIIEIGVATPVLFNSLWSVFVIKSRGRQKLRLRGDLVPTVDILITACGEDDDLILNTARAACNIDYPHDRFRVFVLDDGRSDSLFRAIVALQIKYPNLFYRSREKNSGVPHDFKAGNLNFGIQQTWSAKGDLGEYIAALDADMIPEPEWLRAMLPHMLLDAKCGLSCPPQLFYNVPPSDPLYQSLDFFVHVSEPIKDALGVAWCTGSGYVIRRNALNQIGQIPVGSVAEDVLCSTMLLAEGWRTAYVHEPLQFGTVPEDYGGHIKQRTRWTVGTMQTASRLRFSIWGSNIRRLTVAQRLSGFMYAIISLFNIFLTMSLFAMPAVLISGGRMVAYAEAWQLRWLIRACWLAFTINRISELSMFLPSGYLTGQRGSRAILWMAPYHTMTMLRVFVLPSWLGGQGSSFKPTGSLNSELKERSARERAPLFRRLKVILWNYFGGFHLLYLLFVLAAVITSTTRCNLQQPTRNKVLLCLLTHAFWPPVSWLVYVAAAWTPIIYAIRPPSVPGMDDLLQVDQQTEVAYPKEQSKSIKRRQTSWFFEIQYSSMTLYTTAIFALSWIY